MSAISQAIMARPVASAVRRVDAAATIGAPFRAAAAPLMLARAVVPRGLGRGALMVTRAKVESHNEMHPGALERDTSKYTYYEVKEGEYLMVIGKKFDMTWDELEDANKDSITTPEHMIWPGEVLRIPTVKYNRAMSISAPPMGRFPLFLGAGILIFLLAGLLKKLKKEPTVIPVPTPPPAPAPVVPKAAPPTPPPPPPPPAPKGDLASLRLRLPSMTAIEFLSLPVVSIAALAPNLSTYQLEGVASRISWGNMSYQLGAIVPNLSIPQLAVLLPALSCPMLAEAMVLLPARTLNTLLTDTSLSVGPGLCRKCPDTMKDALPGLDAPTQAYLKPFLGMGESGDKCDKVRAMSDDQITKEFPSKSMGDLTNLIGCLSEPQLKKVLLLLSDPQIKAVMPLLATGAVVEAVPPCSDAQLGAAIPAMDATQLKAFTTQYSARFAGYAAAAPGLSESQVRAVLPSVPDFTAAAMFPRMSSANMLVAAPLLSAAAAKMGVAAVGEADQAAVVPLLAAPQLDTVLPVLTPPVLSTVRGAVAPKLPLVAKSTIDKLTDPQLVALGLLAGVAPAPAVARAGTGWAPGGLPKDKAAPGEFKQVGFWAAIGLLAWILPTLGR